jgi:biofilm PGA synthesis N-glycosyltransferase PgaC
MSTGLVVLIAAHNEEHCIAATLRSLLRQERTPDRIVVAADNCTDATVAMARAVPGVTIFETTHNKAKKPGALNQAWRRFARDADLVVCMDADTTLDQTALGDWENEFRDDPTLGGCSAKFTMLAADGMTRREKLLVRLQRAEFAKWTDLALKRQRKTSVLAGTACCIRNESLLEVERWRFPAAPTSGPWIESSLVEDFELTYRMRQCGWSTKVSATVRAYTDAMTDMRSLWAQRMKWQTGTVEDLLAFGVNRMTRFDWWQQVQGAVAIAVRMVWVVLLVRALLTRTFALQPLWLLPPALFLLNDIKQAFRIPMREPADIVVAALFFPQEGFAWLRAAWFATSWVQVLSAKALSRRPKDLWGAQARAERSRSRVSAVRPGEMSERLASACAVAGIGDSR